MSFPSKLFSPTRDKELLKKEILQQKPLCPTLLGKKEEK